MGFSLKENNSQSNHLFEVSYFLIMNSMIHWPSTCVVKGHTGDSWISVGIAVLKDRGSCLQVPKFDHLVTNRTFTVNYSVYKTELWKGLVGQLFMSE